MSLDQHSETTNTSITPQIDRETPQDAPVVDSVVRPQLFRRLDFTEDVVGFRGGSSKRSGIKLAMWTWLSAAVDTMMMIALSCFFVIAFSLLMKTSAREVIHFVWRDFSLLKIFGAAFLVSFWMYMVFLRGFNGATIGEWTCSLRLGQPWQRLQSGYILKVFLRTTLIMMTGIVVIPLLSLVFRRDLAGDLTGLKIYSLD